jgi:hypothetical protein
MPVEGEAAMRNSTGRFVALAMASALIAGCSTQQASTPQASVASVADPGAPIVFRLVRDERNPTRCTRFDTGGLSRGHTFRATGNTASITAANGITRNMTQTSPGVYVADNFTWGQVTFQHVVDTTGSPKSLTVTEPNVGCRWSAVAP